jgi:hypothetical protein
MRSDCSVVVRRVIAHSSKTDKIAVFRFSRKAIALSSHSAQVKAIASPTYFEETSLKLDWLTSNNPTECLPFR